MGWNTVQCQTAEQIKLGKSRTSTDQHHSYHFGFLVTLTTTISRATILTILDVYGKNEWGLEMPDNLVAHGPYYPCPLLVLEPELSGLRSYYRMYYQLKMVERRYCFSMVPRYPRAICPLLPRQSTSLILGVLCTHMLVDVEVN